MTLLKRPNDRLPLRKKSPGLQLMISFSLSSLRGHNQRDELARETERSDRLCVPLVDRQLTGEGRGRLALLASNGNFRYNSTESTLLRKYCRVCPSMCVVAAQRI